VKEGSIEPRWRPVNRRKISEKLKSGTMIAIRANNSKNYLSRKVFEIIWGTSRGQNNVVLHAEARQTTHLVAKLIIRQVGRTDSRLVILANVQPQLMGPGHQRLHPTL
jgi:hypothetical protein